MDTTMIKRVEQMARAAEQQAREAVSKTSLTEVELRNEIESLKAQVALLEGQLGQQKLPSLKDKCDALTEVLANCYQSGEQLEWSDWVEIRKQYAPDGDPDLGQLKEFFVKGQGKDLYKAVVSKPVSPNSEAVTTPAPSPVSAPASEATMPATKKSKLRGRVSTEPTVTLVDDPDSLDSAPAPVAATPSPTFDSPSAADVSASLEEIASAGGLAALPSESLGRLSSVFRSALTGADAPTVKGVMHQVGQEDSVPAPDRKRIIQFLIEGAAPVALQEALLSSSPFVADCFSTLFF